MVYHPRGPVAPRRVARAEPLPIFVPDLGAAWRDVIVEHVTLVVMVHIWDGEQNIVWGRVVREYLPNLCGPLSISAATQVAELLGSRVQWLSKLHGIPTRMHNAAEEGKPENEPTLHTGKKDSVARKGPVKAHLQ